MLLMICCLNAGCDDALVRHRVRKGEIQIDYNREAESALMAFRKWRNQKFSKRTVPGARFLESETRLCEVHRI